MDLREGEKALAITETLINDALQIINPNKTDNLKDLDA